MGESAKQKFDQISSIKYQLILLKVLEEIIYYDIIGVLYTVKDSSHLKWNGESLFYGPD